MPGLREFGLAGAALAVTGTVVYVIWRSGAGGRRRGAGKAEGHNGADQDQGEKFIQQEIISCEEVSKPPQKVQPRGGQVLVLGLDGAGKSSLLQCFVNGCTEQDVTPTKGFNAVSINREELHIEFLEIGGEEKLREYWPMYLKNAGVLVFVLDAADPTRFPLAKASLHQLLTSKPYLPLVLIGNKQDLPGACGVTELYDSMGLGSLGEGHKLCALGTQIQKGSSTVHPTVQDAYELILDTMNSNCME